jgi:hypothetical protein
MHIGLHVECPIFLLEFNETWIFLTDFSKNIQMSNLMKIRSVEAELFHAYGPTDRYDGANSRFSQFCERA